MLKRLQKKKDVEEILVAYATSSFEVSDESFKKFVFVGYRLAGILLHIKAKERLVWYYWLIAIWHNQNPPQLEIKFRVALICRDIGKAHKAFNSQCS